MGGPNIIDLTFKMVSVLAAVVVAAMLMSGGHNSGQPVQALPESSCQLHLRAIRNQLASVHAQQGMYPASLYDLGRTGGSPVDVRCPSSDVTYIYDPERLPGHLVICPNPEHRSY